MLPHLVLRIMSWLPTELVPSPPLQPQPFPNAVTQGLYIAQSLRNSTALLPLRKREGGAVLSLLLSVHSSVQIHMNILSHPSSCHLPCCLFCQGRECEGQTQQVRAMKWGEVSPHHGVLVSPSPQWQHLHLRGLRWKKRVHFVNWAQPTLSRR